MATTAPASTARRPRGPRITITCHCGQAARLAYGAQWRCDQCGRRWDTSQIPAEQYAAVRAVQLRYRRVPIAISVLALACVVATVLAGKAFGALIIVAIIATTWSMFFRPMHRRRHRAALAQLPGWTLTASDDDRP
jgi:hypothetical protein